MSEIPDDYDPGRNWRRLARCGAVLTLSSIFIQTHSTSRYSALFHEFPRVMRDFARYAIQPQPRPYEDAPLEALISAWFLLLPVLSIANIIACSRRVLMPQSRGFHLCVIIFAWLVAFILPYPAARVIFHDIDAKSTIAAMGIIGLLSYWFIALLTLANSRRWRGTALLVFCIEIAPLFLFTLLTVLVCAAVVLGSLNPPSAYEFAIGGSCMVGALMMLVGWMMWWRAVNTAHEISVKAIASAGGGYQ